MKIPGSEALRSSVRTPVEPVAAVDPGKATGLAIPFVQRWMAAIEAVEIADQVMDALVIRQIEQVPIQRRVVVPFLSLCKLAAMKSSFLPPWAKSQA